MVAERRSSSGMSMTIRNLAYSMVALEVCFYISVLTGKSK
jgi:hypothetical protein